MKNQDQQKVNKTQEFQQQPSKFAKLRFPFMQKQVSTPMTNTTESPSPMSSSSSLGFFNLRKFASKQPIQNTSPRKVVSFAPGTMDIKQKIQPDHTDVAYREAFSKLRNVLNPKVVISTSTPENLNTVPLPKQNSPNFYNQPEEKISIPSNFLSYSFKKDDATIPTTAEETKIIVPFQQIPQTLNNRSALSALQAINKASITNSNGGNSDLIGFIDKQGEYIIQLEKETKYCRQELSTILDKVKDVIIENEALHEKQKREMLTSMIQQLEEKSNGGKRYEISSNGKSDQVIRDSRIVELEAQIVQYKRNLRLSQEENLELRKGNGFTDPSVQLEENLGILTPPNSCELHLSQIESLSREKKELMQTISKFKQMMSELRDRESEASRKVKSSLEIVDQMKEEKIQADMETRRLKEELDRHQQRVREMIQENSRKLHEEKLQVEKKYRQEIDHLSNEMNSEFDILTKTKLELERQKRFENELRRELQLKINTIDDLRVEMQIKINHLQTELSHTLSQKSTAEQELLNSRLQAEKIERDGKQESSKLQMELNLLRKRLEESDGDVRKSQEVILRLNDNISQLQRDASLAKIRLEGHLNSDDGDLNSIIQAVEDKQSRDMTELEQLIQVQNNLLDKLRNECKQLADKLEETTNQNKKNKTILEGEKERLLQTNKVSLEKCADLEHKLNFYASSHTQMTSRLQKLEEDDKSRSEKIFTLLSKQSGIMKENQNLQNEVSYLKRRMDDTSTSTAYKSLAVV